MTATHLYEIADLRAVLDAALAANEGELTPDLETALDAIDSAFEEKAERVALYIRERLALAKAIKEEEDRLEARRTALTKAATSLTAYLHQQMERVGKDKVTGLLCTIALQNNPPQVREVVATTEADLRDIAITCPQFVRRTPETFAWDRDAIKAAAKAGTLPADIATRVDVVQSKGLRIR